MEVVSATSIFLRARVQVLAFRIPFAQVSPILGYPFLEPHFSNFRKPHAAVAISCALRKRRKLPPL